MKLLPTRRTDYGIRALLYLAEHGGGRSKAAEIAEAMDIPQGFLHQVLQELQRARLVTSRPSRHGGYALARPAEEISILEIVEGLEGPLEPEECALRGGPCHWDDVCALHWVWSSATQALTGQLASATLAQVAADDLALAAGEKLPPADAHRGRTRKEQEEQRRTAAAARPKRVRAAEAPSRATGG